MSQRHGRPSNRRTKQAVKDAILAQVRARYGDFGPTLASEYLAGDGFKVSKETLRRWMIEAGLWQAKMERMQRPHRAVAWAGETALQGLRSRAVRARAGR